MDRRSEWAGFLLQLANDLIESLRVVNLGVRKMKFVTISMKKVMNRIRVLEVLITSIVKENSLEFIINGGVVALIK